MPFDRFMIAPINTGLETDLRPWLIPDDAFQQLKNAYVFRGRVRKRFGSVYSGYGWANQSVASLNSRLAVGLGSTNSETGDISGTVPGSIFKVGQLFSIGTALFTVTALGTPANLLRSDGVVATATFNTSTGAYVINGATPSTVAYFYPSEPVMNLSLYEVGPINDEPAYAFDTQFAYTFTAGYWLRTSTTGGATPVIWHGSNYDFFWTCTWDGITPGSQVFFVTNFNATAGAAPGATDDPLWYFDGTNWSVYTPTFITGGSAGGYQVKTARIIVPFKNRLVLLNTIESNSTNTLNTAYVNRCRYSQNGSPLASGAWYEPNQAGALGGGYIDAATEESIIGAEFIKDRLIVYFERSTWELAYTGNQVLPFVWQKINTELGSESTFSSVPFDKVVLTIGETGVHACNGANVERIDNLIPDYIFAARDDNEGVSRVAGIRDYYTEMVYWTIPSGSAASTANTYPNQILVYNYKNGSWAINDDCITAFGYFQQSEDTTWESTTTTWEESNFTWNSGVIQANYRQIVAGNQQGFVYIISPDESSNAPVMQITNAANNGAYVNLTIVDHTLGVGDYIQIEHAQGTTGINGNIYPVYGVPNSYTVTIGPVNFTGSYLGGGTVARVSNIQITSKQWNPYVDKGRNFFIQRIDFGVLKTSDGEITVDYAPSSSNISMLNDATDTASIMGNGILETSPYQLVPLERTQNRLWHPIYMQTDGTCIQIMMYLSEEQITNPAIANSDFQLEGMILHCMPTSDRLR